MALGFDARHPRAEAFTRSHAGNLITAIIEDQRQSIRSYITSAVEAGRAPGAVALEIVGRIDRAAGKRTGGIIGLTSQQSGYVANMRAELGDPERMAHYFTREKRDRRFDGLVRKALESGKPVSKADIERIAGRYADRLLKLRGDMIARTEAITALRAGEYEAWRQVVEKGGLRDDQIIRTWKSEPDQRTRHDHLAMNGMSVRGLSTPFTSPDGAHLKYPGDTSLGAPARDTINCRCAILYKADRRRVT